MLNSTRAAMTQQISSILIVRDKIEDHTTGETPITMASHLVQRENGSIATKYHLCFSVTRVCHPSHREWTPCFVRLRGQLVFHQKRRTTPCRRYQTVAFRLSYMAPLGEPLH